jgi:hypothetical protein
MGGIKFVGATDLTEMVVIAHTPRGTAVVLGTTGETGVLEAASEIVRKQADFLGVDRLDVVIDVAHSQVRQVRDVYTYEGS